MQEIGVNNYNLQVKKKRHKALPLIIIVFMFITACLFFDSYYRIVTTEYSLVYDNLPDAFDGFRIVVLSDIHAAVFGRNNERLVARVRDTHPDIIAITGDFTDYHDKLPTNEQLVIAEALILDLLPIAPIYYVTGNHEWANGGVRELISMMETHGVVILRNKYVHLESGGEKIILAGTEDPNGPADMIRPRDFIRSIRETEGDKFIVLLEHRNNRLPLYSELGVDLMLCGHAHGGIIRLPFTDGLIGPDRDWLPTYTNGVYTMGKTNMVVSRGIGNHTGWPRLLNNPQIVVAILSGGVL